MRNDRSSQERAGRIKAKPAANSRANRKTAGEKTRSAPVPKARKRTANKKGPLRRRLTANASQNAGVHEQQKCHLAGAQPPQKRQFIDPLTTIRELLDEYERCIVEISPYLDASEALRRLSSIRAKLEEPIRLSFLGGFSVGKSNIINSLLGKTIAPVKIKPTTATITYFSSFKFGLRGLNDARY